MFVIEENVKRYSNQNTRDHIIRNLYDSCYNCWGFTACMIGWIEYLDWIKENRMTTYLLQHTIPVKEPQNGDIAVYVYDNDIWFKYEIPKSIKSEDRVLSHTAIIIDVEKELLIQKPGGRRINIQNFRGTLNDHGVYGPITEFRRVVEPQTI